MVDAQDDGDPGLGQAEIGQGRHDHHQRGARHAGDTLGRHHQQQQHEDLLLDAEMHPVRLHDEHGGEGAIQHRSVQVERIAQRQDEADDAAAHADPRQGVQDARIGGFRTGRREGQQGRGADLAEQRDHPLAQHRGAGQEQQEPQHAHGAVEAQHELGVGAQHVEALGGDGRGQGGEDGEGRQLHHELGHLQHDAGGLLDQVQHRRGLVVQGCDRRADEDREDHDLQDFIARHGVEDRRRHQVGDEAVQREGVRRRRRPGGGDRLGQMHPRAGLQQLHQNQTQHQRHHRGADEPGHGLDADAADRSGVLHMGDARHQGGEHQRGDDHLDQPQEDVRDQIEVGRRCRSLISAEKMVEPPPRKDPQNHRSHDEISEQPFHTKNRPTLRDRRRRVRGYNRWRIPTRPKKRQRITENRRLSNELLVGRRASRLGTAKHKSGSGLVSTPSSGGSAGMTPIRSWIDLTRFQRQGDEKLRSETEPDPLQANCVHAPKKPSCGQASQKAE
ncbi:hypothetical protein D3C77_263090 [compost metagenome]